MSGLHGDALRTLDDWAGPTVEQERLRRDYVTHLRDRPDGLHRACLPDHLTTGALVLSASGDRVLLTLHRKAGQWFHTGGHCEHSDATLAGAALREATEESGVAQHLLTIDPVPVHLDAHDVAFCGGATGCRHLDVRFVALAPDDAEPVVGQESHDVRWWPATALPDTPDLPALVAAARRRWEARRGSQPSSAAT